MTSHTGHLTAIIAVGDELLGGFTLDTNSHHLAQRAYAAGRPVGHIEVVPDEPAAIAEAIRRAVADRAFGRIVVGGGVGPTPDDRSLEGVGLGLSLPLEENAEVLRLLEERMAMLQRTGIRASAELSPANRRTATMPVGPTVHPNPVGMAPLLAYALAGEDRWLFVLPGVPREFDAICETLLIPLYFGGGLAPALEEIRYRGIPESEFAAPMIRLAAEFPAVQIGSYPQTERRELVIRIRGTDQVLVSSAAERLRQWVPVPDVAP